MPNGLLLSLKLLLSRGVSALPWFTQGKADDTDPSFWADFANNRYAVNGAEEAFNDIFTFTRSTTGTYFDANGVMQTAAIDTPRFDYDPETGEPLGLLIEEQRTNLQGQNGLTVLNNFATWEGITTAQITRNATVAPDGTNTAVKWVDRAGINGTHFSYSFGNITSGTSYAFSIYAKAAEHYLFHFGARNVGPWAEFDLSAGTVVRQGGGGGGTASIEPVGNGWYRCAVSYTASTSIVDHMFIALNGNVSSTSPQRSYLGTGEGIYLWGVQDEVGRFPSSYIPTNSAAVTRSADNIKSDAATPVPFASWYNQTEGMVYAEYDVPFISNGTWSHIFIASNGTNNERFQIAIYDKNHGMAPIWAGGVAEYYPSPQYAVSAGAKIKAALAATTNDARVYLNATALAGDTSVIMPTVDRAYIGRRADGTANEMHWGHVKEFRYYPSRISNTELQRITTP